LSGSDGSHAYSVLRLFSYRVQVEHVDSASRLIAARLWASDHPASGVEFSWAEKPGRTDGEGRFRVVDPELSEGVNRRSLDVDGVAVPFEYGSSSGILSSWPDRLLALGAVGLFGVAWWANRRAAVRIRLLPPEFHPLRVHVPSALFARLFEDVPKASALSVREFTARLHTLLADPQLVLPPEQIRKLLQDAESRGAVLLKGNAATWLAHHASKTGALEALFWRNVSDGLLAQGWSFRRLGARLYCRRDKRARILDARPTDGKVRWRGTVHWHSVDDAGPEYFR